MVKAQFLIRSVRPTLVSLAIALLSVSGACLAGPSDTAQTGDTGLQQGFVSPPESARPRVWWHWLNGNVTENGIRKDLEWMHSIGIGGVDAISADIATPRIVKNPAVYMTPRWKSDIRLAAKLAGRYGMEFGINSSPGWSETGGPWVKPSQAMKKLVWSKTVVQGGKPFRGILPKPPSNTGPFQNAPMSGSAFQPSKYSKLRFYRDNLVIAYKAPVLDPKPVSAALVTGSLDSHALSELSDGSLTDGITLTASGGKSWLELHYPSSVRLQGVTLDAASTGTTGVLAAVYVSDNGKNWKAVTHLHLKPAGFGQGFPLITASFAPVTARYARVVFTAAPPQKHFGSGLGAPGAVPAMEVFASHFHIPPRGALQFHVRELVLHARATVNRFAAKAYFNVAPNYYALASEAPVAAGTAVNPEDVVNLTGRMKPDGTLDWTPPPGRWVVLRMGYSLEGTTNHPAPAAATGLEVDKLSREDVKSYINHYLDTYQTVVGSFGHSGSVGSMTNDSTEVGMQNWTDDILQDFKKLNGYDPVSWLPALTGVVVGSPQQSDRFLWDFRHTINDLVATNHYQEISNVAHARGLFTYGEALENGRPTFGDGMRMRQYANVPMGAMWTWGNSSGLDPSAGPYPSYVADLSGARSVADIYGRKLVAAESMTSIDEPWAYAPRELKPVVDREFTLGVNRVFIHESAEQPVDKPPGLSLSVFGQMFNRLDTWAGNAGSWIKYIARCSYLLQQGRHVAGIAYFYGQEAPITGMFQHKAIDMPKGYGFDFVNADVLLHMLNVDDGQLVTHSGMRFRVLYLGGSSRFMTLEVLRRIDQLVKEGATVVGQRPVASPSLKDDQSKFQALATALFGKPDSETVRHIGAGTVYPWKSLPKALKALHFKPDFAYSKPEPDTKLLFIHRKLDQGGSIYFVSNRRNRPVRLAATFRVAGRVPQLWNAVTGTTEPVSFTAAEGRTSVPLVLPSFGSVFVVFRKPAAHASRTIAKANPQTLVTLHGPWKVTFQADRGAPQQINMKRLTSWSKSSVSGVKYFSGTGTYHKTFQLSNHTHGTRVVLDLGQVWQLARVSVNGKSAGTVWTPPFRLDITQYVHPGENTLAIAVTNPWANRLIGDARPNAKKKYTFTTHPTYEPNAPLQKSGLIGPVRIEQVASPQTGND